MGGEGSNGEVSVQGPGVSDAAVSVHSDHGNSELSPSDERAGEREEQTPGDAEDVQLERKEVLCESAGGLGGPVVAAMQPASVLFEVQGTPVVRVDMWSHRLNMWVYLVPQRTGQNPAGTLEVTPEDIETLRQWLEAGWELGAAIQQILGVVVTVRA